MYDFIKMAYTDPSFADQLINNPLLDFNTLVNEKTGVVKDGINEADYKNLKFTVYPSGRVEIQGSLHKYWNDGHHNWNDFTLEDATAAIEALQATFNINPTKATVHNLEFGVNVNTAFNPDDFLNNLITHKNQPFNKMKTRGRGNGKEVYYQRYGIKVYNKGLQYGRPDNILRFEKKVMKMECLNYGEVKLSDLLSLGFFNHCYNQLITSFEELIISDKVKEKQLTNAELKLYDKCKNPLNWRDMTRFQSCRNKPKFNQIISKYGKAKYRDTTLKLLQEKCNKLTGVLKTKVQQINRSISRLERCISHQRNSPYNSTFLIAKPENKSQENYGELSALKTSTKPRNFCYI